MADQSRASKLQFSRFFPTRCCARLKISWRVFISLVLCRHCDVAGRGSLLTGPKCFSSGDLLALLKAVKQKDHFVEVGTGSLTNWKPGSGFRRPNLRGGWGDDSDDHVISLTGAEDHNRNNRAPLTPSSTTPRGQGVMQDIGEKVSLSF